MVKINTEYITLSQLFKMENIASSGGEAKHLIETMKITVNNQEEHHRGKKLFPGDEIIIEGKKYTIE